MIGFLLQGVCRATSSYIINLTTGGAKQRFLFFLYFFSDERIAFCFYPLLFLLQCRQEFTHFTGLSVLQSAAASLIVSQRMKITIRPSVLLFIL